MFGEAFAAELGDDGHASDSSFELKRGGIKMTNLEPKSNKWMVGGGGADHDVDDLERKLSSETGEDLVFSKYVFPAVKDSFLSMDVFKGSKRKMSPEQSKEELELNYWLKHNKASLNSTKLKSIVRRHVPPSVRARLWQEVSGGSSFMSKVPNLYHDTCQKLFGKEDKSPENITSCTLANDNGFMSYYLTADGVLSLRKVLYVLSYLHPDITFCPILQQIAAVFLHFMEDVWCFACMSAMLTGKKMYFDQTNVQSSATEHALHSCALISLKKETKKLQGLIMDLNWRTESTLVPEWDRMIFQYLDITILVRLVDCFLVEGPKVFFRTCLFLLRLFYEYTLKYEKIELPTTNDLRTSIGKYSEALKIPADDFIKASLRIRIKNKQINTAIEKYLAEWKNVSHEVDETKDEEKLITFDVTNISNILTPNQWHQVITWLPARIQLLKPEVAFTTDVDGFSLKTLYNRVEEEEQTVIVIKTDHDEVFGAYLSMPLETRKHSYKSLAFFGNGETFIFSMMPLMEKFSWTEIDEADAGKHKRMPSQKNSYVFVDIKGSPRRRKRSLRISRRKVSFKLQGIPKNLSLADLPNQPSYGGIPKNSSVVHLHSYAKTIDTGHNSGHTSSTKASQDEHSGVDTSVISVSDMPSVFSNESTPTAPEPSSKSSRDVIPSYSLSEGHADEYQNMDDKDIGDGHRVTKLSNDLCIVEKRVELDVADGEKEHPEHAHHVEHAANDLFVAGDNSCFIVGGGGGNGIWLDESLYRGRSEVCNTFHNRVLTKGSNGDFTCVRLEVFKFREPEL